MIYPKIHSLWKREGWYFSEDAKHNPKYQDGRQSLIEGDYACPEFGNIQKWLVQEKIDGTNIRIDFHNPQFPDKKLDYKGRTEEAHLPDYLTSHLKKYLSLDILELYFHTKENGVRPHVMLFGEGYGPKIQKGGGNYRKDPGFILFDVWIDGWWLNQSEVEKVAVSLNIPYAPIIGIMTESEIVTYVKSNPMSLCSEVNPQVMEGVIARSEPLVLFRDGTPLKFKLKCIEFTRKK